MSGAVLGATYALPLASLTTQELTAEKERLTLQPRQTFGPPVPPVCAWEERGGILHVPRFYGLQRFGPAETDLRTEGDSFQTEVEFTGELTPVQARVSEALLDGPLSSKGPHGAIVCLPCGYGKTVWGVHFVCAMKRKACILVHKAVIRDQWRATFERFCPGLRVGIVQGSTWETDADVVIAMVLTIARQAEEPPAVFDSFGVVIADEAHHYAAPVMNRSMRLFRARWIVGLTATKERPDGLTPLLHWCMGPEGFRVQRNGGERVRVSVALYEGAVKEILTRDGKPLVSMMINRLAAHSGRNDFLAQRIIAMRRDGRVILVLSDRLAQLRTLRDLVLASGIPEEDLGLFVGSTKESQRQAELSKSVVFCSYSMANEGLDKKEADAMVMATPKSRITQCIGRIQRPCETKQTPLVLDVADCNVQFFQQMRWRRHQEYRREGYDVQTLHASTEGWWR